jgi:hypothetical protein
MPVREASVEGWWGRSLLAGEEEIAELSMSRWEESWFSPEAGV